MASSSSSSRLSSLLSKTLNHRFPFPALNSSFDRTLSTVAETPLESSFQAQGNERRRWTRWLLFLPGAITFGLGSWQIFRRQDKISKYEKEIEEMIDMSKEEYINSLRRQSIALPEAILTEE